LFGLDLSILLWTIGIVLGSGLVAAILLGRFSRNWRITVLEYGICAALLIGVFTPGVSWAGTQVAQANSVGGYQEIWGGSITEADSHDTKCDRDGDCVHTYRCDPHDEWEIVRYDTQYYTDSKGKQQSRQVPVYGWVTHYHSCPYATDEYDYWLMDSFGNRHDIASNVFAQNAKEWRAGSGLGGFARGIPAEWQAAKAGIDAGDAPPAHKLNTYTNYLLAAQDSLLSAYSDSVDKYRKAGLLPYHTVHLTTDPIYGGYKADEMMFTGGLNPSNYGEWQQALGRLNSYLGSERQGDLHVLAVPASRISDSEDYANALLAYWQSRQIGKMGLAKNTIMLVLGVSDDGRTVVWSRAKTGIPQGNGAMLSALSTNLEGAAFEPKSLIGWPQAKPQGGKLTFTPSAGKVEQIVMRDYPFLRLCMDCKDKSDHGTSYVYLKSSAFISTGAKIGIDAVVFFLGLLVFFLAAVFDFRRIGPAIWRGYRSIRERRVRSTW
jgi:hypothetical protein